MSLKFKLTWLTTLFMISLCCGMPITLLSFHIFGTSYVLNTIAPPDYPNSQFIKEERGGGSGGTWTKYIYYTSDEVKTVLAFLENEQPSFTQYPPDFYSNNQPSYGHSMCAYETALGQYFYSRGSYPCASITLYKNTETGIGTTIEVFWSYPDP